MAKLTEQIKELREKTGAGVMECRSALEESKGDLEKAAALLRERGAELAQSKVSRKAEEGTIMAYVHHGGKLGSLVELNCESDFVARNEEFIGLAKELAMQIAATSPKYISREDMPADFVEGQKAEFAKQAKDAGKGGSVEEYVKERLEGVVSQVCLLEQPYIRDAAVTVNGLISDKVGKFRERIRVKRFVVFKLGEQDGEAA